jgi:hypothetical protein
VHHHRRWHGAGTSTTKVCPPATPY